MLNHLKAYLYYLALLATPRYHNQRTRTIEATAEYCRMQLSTVYRAIRNMQQPV
ncbi:MAG: hypothetical protein ACRYG7_39995 [Janthinobacterium lividum]